MQSFGQPHEERLINFDFHHIDLMDPCLEGGYVIIYDQELPFLVRFIESDHEDKHTIEMLRVRVMILGKPKQFTQMTLELTSENDLFFYYFHTVDQQNFTMIKNAQQLSIDFQDYPEVVIKSFQKCQNEQSQQFLLIDPYQRFAPVLNLMVNQRAKVQVLQTLEYKELEIIVFQMIAGDEDIIRQHATFRYASVKSRYKILGGKLKDTNDIVKQKNPQLLLFIQKQVYQHKI